MTTEMFGAPYGIQQAEDQINKNVLSGLKAQQLIGEIEKQPAERLLAESHARLFQAQAGKAEAEAKETGEYKQFVAQALQGLSAPGQPPGQAQSLDKLYQIGILGAEKGFLKPSLDVLNDVTTIKQREAAVASSRAQTVVSQLKAQQEVSEQLAAETASITTPEQYSGWLAMQASRGRDTSWMPQTFDARAKQMLNTLTAQGISASKQIELKMQATKDASMIKENEAQTSAAFASAKLSGARLKIAEEDLTVKKKYAGPQAEATLEATKAREKASKAYSESQEVYRSTNERKQLTYEATQFSTLTPAERADPALRKDGKTYFTGPNGAGTWDAKVQRWIPFKSKKP